MAINKKDLQKLLRKGYSIRKIANYYGKGYSTIRFYLRKFSISVPKRITPIHLCKICGKKVIRRTICGSCHTKIRRYATKYCAVKLLGGKCVNCGWIGEVVGFDFHHVDNNKEFEIGRISNKSWKIVKKEILKCRLLCAICHRLGHSNYKNKRLLSEVEKQIARMGQIA